MIERMMFELEPFDMRIVSMIQFRDYVLLATERYIYRLRHDAFDENIRWHKVIEKNDDTAPRATLDR